MTRAARDFARAELARWEHWYRTQAHGLDKTVEADADRLLAHGVETDASATQEERRAATLAAWQRVDEGRTRAAGLRLVARVLGLVLRAMGGTPVRDRDAPPETKRTIRRAMFGDEVEAHAAGEREPVRLDKGAMVEAAEKHGIMQEDMNA